MGSENLSIFVPFIAGKYIVGIRLGKIKRFIKKINRFLLLFANLILLR